MRFFQPLHCDSGIQIGVGTNSEFLQSPEGMVFARHPDNDTPLQSHSAESRPTVASQAYRQGYIEASRDHIMRSPEIDVAQRYHSTAVPPFLVEMLGERPYTTAAAIGAGTVLSFLGGAYSVNLLRSYLRGAGPTTTVIKSVNGGQLEVVLAKRMDDLERRIVTHIQSVNRDKTAGADNFKREILNAVRGSGSTSSASVTSAASISEDRIARLQGLVEAANKDRRSELHAFRSEIMGQLQMMEEQVVKVSTQMSSSPSKLDPSDWSASAPIAPGMDEARLGQVLRSAVEDVLSTRESSTGGLILEKSSDDDVATSSHDTWIASDENPSTSTENVYEPQKSSLDGVRGRAWMYKDDILKHTSSEEPIYGQLQTEEFYDHLANFVFQVHQGMWHHLMEAWAIKSAYTDEQVPAEIFRHQPLPHACDVDCELTVEHIPLDDPVRSDPVNFKRRALYPHVEELNAVLDLLEEATTINDVDESVRESGKSAMAIVLDKIEETDRFCKYTDAWDTLDKSMMWPWEEEIWTAQLKTGREQALEAEQSASRRLRCPPDTDTISDPSCATSSDIEVGNNVTSTMEDNLETSTVDQPKANAADESRKELSNSTGATDQILKDDGAASTSDLDVDRTDTQSSSHERSEADSSSPQPSPRFGIDNSGRWSFTLTTPAYGAWSGLHSAQLLYSAVSHNEKRGDGFIFSSSSSSYVIHPGVEVIIFPEIDVAKVDGRMWRCQRNGEEWIIKEEIKENKTG